MRLTESLSPDFVQWIVPTRVAVPDRVVVAVRVRIQALRRGQEARERIGAQEAPGERIVLARAEVVQPGDAQPLADVPPVGDRLAALAAQLTACGATGTERVVADTPASDLFDC
jgi:hypothetical protein